MRLNFTFFLAFVVLFTASADADRPNIVLVMADDQGWGQTGYYDHPVLKTPNLDAMADGGLRLDRFYAGAPVCSPTRAAVLTGRTNDRTGVLSHGYALRRQEISLASVLRDAGYVTGHFGKWHLNGYRGPGVPILESDDHNPGEFGFDAWLSVTNFFDRDPILSRRGKFEEFKGDSSEIVVDEALDFIARQAQSKSPSFTVIWFGSPHSPFEATDVDNEPFEKLNAASMHHHGELVAMDRSIGTLRSRLRELDIADNTIVWYCSDNGGLPKITPSTTGGLRGNKGSVYEGGLRVPAIIEWPAVIKSSRITTFPAGVVDIMPTLMDITDVVHPATDRPSDGVSLLPLIDVAQDADPPEYRDQPLGFRYFDATAWIDGDMKLMSENYPTNKFQLYDLVGDPNETNDLSAELPELAAKMKAEWAKWNESVDASFAGQDYPEGSVDPSEPEPRQWKDAPEYAPYLDRFAK